MKLALQVLADCIAVSLIVPVLIGLLTGEPLTPELGKLLAAVWIYTILIATPAHWLLPRIYPLVVDRHSAAQWMVFVAAMTTISLAGSLVGSVIVFGLGLEPTMTLTQVISLSIRLSVFLGVLVGVIHAMAIVLHDRLQSTEERLHAQELESERAHKLAAEAHLAALESRVHPHFLFNALNTVSSLIPTAPVRAESLIERISALLRFSLETRQSGLVPLKEEIKVVRDYLEIERERFGERLRFAIDENHTIAEKLIPPLAVQTLVENSVKYAVAPSREGAEIRVRTFLENEYLRIEVADTGPGLSNAHVPAGHGLDNVRRRLKVLFGDEEALRIARRDGWTIVGFRVPA
jgi:sensor histidine kinase YesM